MADTGGLEEEMHKLLSESDGAAGGVLPGGGGGGERKEKKEAGAGEAESPESKTASLSALAPSSDPVLLMTKVSELSVALHTSQLKEGHQRLARQALKNSVLGVQAELETARQRAAAAEERTLLLAAKLADKESDDLGTSLPVLRGKELDDACKRANAAVIEADKLRMELEEARMSADELRREASCELVALREQLRQVAGHLAQRTVLYAAAQRAGMEGVNAEVRAAHAREHALTEALARESCLKEQAIQLQQELSSMREAKDAAEQKAVELLHELALLGGARQTLESDLAASQMRVSALETEARSRPADVLEAERQFAEELQKFEAAARTREKRDAFELQHLSEELAAANEAAQSAKAERDRIVELRQQEAIEIRDLRAALHAVQHGGGDALIEQLLKQIEYFKGEVQAAKQGAPLGNPIFDEENRSSDEEDEEELS